jgi:hypothetical protein
MATTTPRRSPSRTPPGGPGALFGIFLILWFAFGAALIFNQGALDAAWQWLTGVPIILQVVLWVVFLPITVGLWVWESDWDLWLRLLTIIVIAVFNISALGPKPTAGQKGDTDHGDMDSKSRVRPAADV